MRRLTFVGSYQGKVVGTMNYVQGNQRLTFSNREKGLEMTEGFELVGTLPHPGSGKKTLAFMLTSSICWIRKTTSERSSLPLRANWPSKSNRYSSNWERVSKGELLLWGSSLQNRGEQPHNKSSGTPGGHAGSRIADHLRRNDFDAISSGLEPYM